ncbi:MAG: glycosyl hydrolase family 28-related protein [Pseudonocardiaceae bacterium]
MSDPITWFNHPSGGTPKSAANFNRITNTTKSYVDSKQNVFNVKDYGAVGNGSADDTTAIKDAIAASQTPVYTASGAVWGGVVFLPLGEYKVSSTILVPQSTTLRGQGRDGTWIIAASGFAGPVVRLGDFWSRVEDMKVHCNNVAASTGIMIDAGQEMSGVFRVEVTQWTLTGIHVKQTAGLLNPQHFAIDECEIYMAGSAPVEAVGLRVIDVGRAGSIRRVTVNGANRIPPPAGSVAILFDNCPNPGLYESHTEQFETGVRLVSSRATTIIGLGCCCNTRTAVEIDATTTLTTCISIVNEAPDLPADGRAIRDNSPGGSATTSNISAFYSH